MHKYEIMLANGDRVYYQTDTPFEDFKSKVSHQKWIEIERNTWESTGFNSWSSRPAKASYQTNNIVYINWDKKGELEEIERQKKLEKQIPIKEEILGYEPNFRLWWKYKLHDRAWEPNRDYWDRERGFYTALYEDGFLEQLLLDCKRFRCKTRG